MSDPTIIAAAIVTVIAAVSAAVVTVVNAFAAAKERIIAASERAALLSAANAAADKVTVVAQNAEHIAAHVEKTDAKLDAIKSTTEQAAKDVDGNLKEVRADLQKQTALSASLQDTVTTLTAILVETQKRGTRLSDVRATPEATAPVLTVPASSSVESSLAETAANTKVIAENTKPDKDPER